MVECDSISHDRAPEADAHRDAWMEAAGYSVLRFNNADVLGNAEGMALTIRVEVKRLQSQN